MSSAPVASPSPARPTAPGIAAVLAALNSAGFPGSVQRRRVTTTRKAFRTHRSVEALEPAIPVGSFPWVTSEGHAEDAKPTAAVPQNLLTGITADGEFVALGPHEHGRVRLVGPDEAVVQRALEAHARLHGVRVPGES